jgi:hypothetical protein
MTFEERLRLIKKFDSLIRRKYRGNSVDYAFKMDISRSAFFRLLDYIKNEFDAPICYNKTNGYYEYCKNGIMFFGFLPNEILTEEGMKKIQGGSKPYMTEMNFSKIFSRVSIGGTDET